MMKFFLASTLALMAWVSNASAQNAPIPSEYQSLYTSLSSQISSFQSAVDARWDQTKFPVTFAPQLGSANSNLFTDLLNATHYDYGVITELQQLQATGATGVTVHINFPILSRGFAQQSGTDFQAFVDFYKQLADEVHARGMKLIVETSVGTAAPDTNTQAFDTYLASLNWTQYRSGRTETAVNIAQLIKPDYISLVTEPDSESLAAGQPDMDTTTGVSQLLTQMIPAVRSAGGSALQIGAGMGTWISPFDDWLPIFTGAQLDYLDLHIYPVNRDYLMNAITAADAAHQVNKKVALSEAWLFKITDQELAFLWGTAGFARDAFSFWQPLDIAFLQAMVDYSNMEHAAFFAPSWPKYYSAYLNYDDYKNAPPTQVILASDMASNNAESAAQFTPTGISWLNMVISAPDSSAPTVVGQPSATAAPTAITITWPKSSDNIATAGYSLFRDGSTIGTTSAGTWTELGLQSGEKHTYTVQAFDATGNKAAQSAPLTVQTLDIVPPTPPTNVKVVSVTTSTVTLSWSAATDNSGVVAGYRIMRGTSPTGLFSIGTVNALTYTDSVKPNTTYYYAVKAYDETGFNSQPSPTVQAKTPADTTPPTVPGNFTVRVVSGTQVDLTWSASTDDVKVQNYKVYRGRSADSMRLQGSTQSTGYTDSRVSPNQTYYYAVAANDSSGNISAWTTTKMVTTPAN